MSKLYNDIPKLKWTLKIIEQYNNFKQLGAEEEIKFLKDKVDNLLNIKDIPKLIEEFTYCAKMVNMFFEQIDPEFKRYAYKEEVNKDEF